jgi:probable HAF family extracellular repeat protein
VAFALGINNRGQVVGVSGVCATTAPPPYVSTGNAVLWERDGTPIDLGSLGGPSAGASAINDRGDVSGTSATADGSVRPFLWTPESRTLLQLNPPEGFPVAINGCCKTINDRREIVGFMFNADFTQQHAFLWKDGVMVDLKVHAFLATPRRGKAEEFRAALLEAQRSRLQCRIFRAEVEQHREQHHRLSTGDETQWVNSRQTKN